MKKFNFHFPAFWSNIVEISTDVALWLSQQSGYLIWLQFGPIALSKQMIYFVFTVYVLTIFSTAKYRNCVRDIYVNNTHTYIL